MRSIAWRYSSMLKMPHLTAKAYSEFARTSQGAWNAGASSVYRTLPNPCLPPRSCMPSMVRAPDRLKARDADHRIASDDRSEPFLRPADRFGRLHGQHHVARVRGRIPHADLD